MMRLAGLVLLSSAAASAASNTTVPAACWKQTQTRGAGKVVSVCPDGQEKAGLLCYPPCKEGYTGVGPVCWENCPAGFHDDGATCRIPLQVISADTSACKWYDKCGLTMDKGCSTCPEGYTNDGCTCRIPLEIKSKKSYGRGAGKPMVCADGLEEDAALCYPPCKKANYNGIGPVCWAECPADFPVKCGAMCGAKGFSCSDKVVSFISETLKEVVACAEAVSTDGASPQTKECVMGIAKLAKDFALEGLCDDQ